MKISGEKLRIARHLAGYSTTDLAKLLGVSKQSLSQYESGTEIKPDIYFKLINILNCDKSFLENPIINEFEIKNTFFRATASANASERNYQQTKTSLVCQIYYYLSNYFDFPQLNLPLFPEEATIEEKAMILRNHWGLGSNPIRNMIKHLENNGIIVSTFNSSNSEESEKIDGYTQQFKLKKEQNDSYQYCIIVENDKRSLFRKNFSLAHELGHVVLHGNDDYMEKTKTEQTQVEKQANEFAAAFLLPRDEFVKDVKGIRTLDDFIKLKSKWFVSIGAMMLRARDLHCITSEDYLKLIKNYSYRKYKSKEPLDDYFSTYKPLLFKQSLELLLKNGIDIETLKSELTNYGLGMSLSQIEEILGLEEDFFEQFNIKKDALIIQFNDKFRKNNIEE